MHRLLALLALAACTPAADGPTDDTDDVVDTDDTELPDDTDTGPVATLTGVSPASGTVGTVVTLTGTLFGADPGDSTVTVGGEPATVTSWSDTEIVIEVPDVLPGSQSVAVTVGGTPDTAAFEVVLPRRVYVSLGLSVGDDGVAVLDVDAAGALTPIEDSPFSTGASGDLSFGGVPGSMAVDVGRRRLFVTGIGVVAVFDIDGRTGALTPVDGSPFDVGDSDPFGVAVSPDGEHLYVSRCNEVDVLHLLVGADGTLEEQDAVELAGCPSRVGFVPGGERLLVTDEVALHVLDVAGDGSLSAVTGSPFGLGGGGTYDWAIDPTGYLYAPIYNRAELRAFTLDGATGALSGAAVGPWTVAEDSFPMGIALGRDAGMLYTSLWQTDAVETFTVEPDGTLTYRGTVATPELPAALQVSDDGALLFVLGQEGHALQAYTLDAEGDPVAAGDPVVFSSNAYPQGLALTGF